ncbi:hypothetical protein KALB_4543 [Kutzneria albida DSM 43870]|uniref:Mutator family transposase n=1 Tax=Kutzneria albida DSM 43870 TaxID=1449976 RepID=W5WAW4_9PSEU|nr:hypothetical protein KALB_4543 [Kutzneria albida DSM 43870]
MTDDGGASQVVERRYYVPMYVFAGSSGKRGAFAAGAQVGCVPTGGFFGWQHPHYFGGVPALGLGGGDQIGQSVPQVRQLQPACQLGRFGQPDAITAVWPATITQTCIVHLLRTSFRYAGRQHWDAIAKALKPVYTAPTEAAARERFAEFTQEWGARYPAIMRLWDNAWAEFVPFLAFNPEGRRVICSTNAIESVNARIRRAVKARGHFPNEQAALKCVYMAVMSLDPTGTGRKRWMMRWKPALNAFEIAFDGRLAAGRR